MVETTAKKVKFSLVSLTHRIRRYMCLLRYFTKNADTKTMHQPHDGIRLPDYMV